MNKAKVKKNIDNLKKIREIIEISKFDTLQKLQKATKISDSYINMAIQTSNLISFAKKTYKIKGKPIKTKSDSVLWIYITPETELMSLSSAKFERMIKKDFDSKKDILIAIGNDAAKFIKKENLKTEHVFETSTNIENTLSKIVSIHVLTGLVKEVKFVFNSPRIGDEPIIAYPIEKLDLKFKGENIFIDKKYKFYPSITQSLYLMLETYFSRITYAFLNEAAYFHLKEKLVRHEGSLKSVDQKILQRTRDLNKLNRKTETDELILVSQIAKREVSDE